MMTNSLRKLTEDLHRIAEKLAEFQRGLDRIDYNLILIQATNQAISDSHSPTRNGHLQ